MLLGDLVYSNIDINCDYEVYDCSNGTSWHEAECVYDSKASGYSKPFDKTLDMYVQYITISNGKMIIEVSKEER